MIWEEETEKIHTEDFVKIIRPDQIITGIGFQSDQSLQNWKIKNPKGTIYVDLKKDKNSGAGVDSVTKPVNSRAMPNEQIHAPPN